MSKTGKTVVTIILTILIVVLVGVMIWGMTGFGFWGSPASGTQNNFWNFGWRGCQGMNNFVISGGKLPADAEKGYEFEVPLADITSVDLNFVHENVDVKIYNGNTVKVQQTSNQKLDDVDVMRFGIVNGAFAAQSGLINRNVPGIRPGSTITLYLPESFGLDAVLDTTSGRITVGGGNYRTLQMDSTSGEINAVELTAKSIDTDTTSGRIELQNINSDSVNADTVSGEVHVTGNAGHEFEADSTSGSVTFSGMAEIVDANTVSGEVTADVARTLRSFKADTTSGRVRLTVGDAQALKEVSANTISGEVTITLPQNDGFTVDYDSISGDLNNEFEMRGERHGNGHIDIDVDTASGSLHILKG